MQLKLPDQELLIRFSQGDKSAFAMIYKNYQRAVFSNISKLIFREDIAEDILQDVFFKLWENRHKFKNEQGIASWLFTVSYNQSISWIRQTIKERKYLSFQLPDVIEEQIAGIEEEAAELKEAVLTDAINQLSARKKEVFELCKLQGKTYAEAAAIMGIAPDTVKEHMIAAIKFVHHYVKANYATGAVGILPVVCFYVNV